MNSNLINVLSQANVLKANQVEAIFQHTHSTSLNELEALFDLELLEPSFITEQLSALFGLPEVDLELYEYQPLCKELGLRDLIIRHQVIPISRSLTTLTLATYDPTNQQTEDDFRFATGLQVSLVVCHFRYIQGAIRRLYGQQHNPVEHNHKEIHQDELPYLLDMEKEQTEELDQQHLDDSPVSRFIQQVLLEAAAKGASDIHFEPYEQCYRVRLRCDGILIETQSLTPQLSRRMTSRIKILAQLDIAERRLPQDGRMSVRVNDTTTIDMRISTLPTLWGEKVVLRLLDNRTTQLDIDQLGFSDIQKKQYLTALRKPQGMILVTGPTGSGKSISLYAGLKTLNTQEVNISTAEDPIEMPINGVNQVQVLPKIGLDFSQALRAFLRQDPDVVMVGEIRDLETAEIAMKASQTGHLVLSTLHTNSAVDTMVRLKQMGIEPFNLASSLSLIVAQRLARCLCPKCKEVDQRSAYLQQHLNLPNSSVLYEANPSGCPECINGYQGRTGVYEVLEINAQITEALMKGANTQELEQLVYQNQTSNLHQSGVEKMQKGLTSYNELQRILHDF
ncbi:type IV-A pilus assembly ATPase PilB [Vibrio sp. 10N.286.49.B3]|uniref:type IV-A pilus assembly ATPase PilB n=1 Tax=Vibrio sp. 10N.286.49.B3 TaxID=1880855 RepID=UPI000C83279A|nr:type IV-A pilus assembly ATPase PilB [Vibrio sp. 10N.286.49.B3]PMH41295.1 type IV-A pilus assembly ATPase PilB [Vibrio sp. 10N.286.49.B3]